MFINIRNTAVMPASDSKVGAAKTETAKTKAVKTGAGTFLRKIGNTIYRVSVHYSNTSKECLEDKILRLAGNDFADLARNNLPLVENRAIMELPQTGRLLEGGSLR